MTAALSSVDALPCCLRHCRACLPTKRCGYSVLDNFGRGSATVALGFSGEPVAISVRAVTSTAAGARVAADTAARERAVASDVPACRLAAGECTVASDRVHAWRVAARYAAKRTVAYDRVDGRPGTVRPAAKRIVAPRVIAGWRVTGR